MNKGNEIYKWISNAILVALTFFGVLVCTKEYNGTAEKSGWKYFLDKSIHLEFSVLFLFILFIIALLIISKIAIFNINRQNDLKNKYSRLMQDHHTMQEQHKSVIQKNNNEIESLTKCVKEYQSQLNDVSSKDDYSVLSKLLVWKYDNFTDEGLVDLNILRIENYLFHEDKNYKLKAIDYDKDKIVDIRAISDPITSYTLVKDSTYCSTITELKGIKKGDSRIIVSESSRKHKISGMLSQINDKEIMYGYGMEHLKKDNDTFAATGFSVKTNHLRMLLYFDKNKFPRHIDVFQITTAGDCHCDNIITECHHGKFLWIVDCTKPITGAELYVVWNWDDVYMVPINTQAI